MSILWQSSPMVSDLLLSTTALARRILPAALRCDRRGATALIFAVSAMAFFGLVGLGTEAGTWYLARRSAQNAADAAALAGAVAIQQSNDIAATAADLATQNGFTTGGSTTVTVRHPPTTGTHIGNQSAVEVEVAQVQPRYLSALFLTTSPTVSARAVGMLQNRSVACLVALSGSVTIQNSSSFNAASCAVASNANMTAAINIPQSNSSVTADKMIAAGTCSGCNRAIVHLTKGYEEYATPVTNVYSYLDAKAAPSVSTCINTAPLTVNGALTPYTTSNRRAYCANVTVSNTSAVTFPSGTYVFRNGSLTIGSIASFACSSCTFLFIGNTPGTLSISNTSTVNITAPSTNSIDSDYNGIIFYRQASGTTGSSSSPTLNLQSVSSFNLAGGIYFPQAYVKMGNVSSVSNLNCLPVIGGTIEIGSLSSYRFDVSNCSAYGTKLPYQQVARLVE
ncbi:MAG: pilus assembly protein TadG-related protein [Geminicoccaceae bacterium]